jgi:hypothetical protein
MITFAPGGLNMSDLDHGQVKRLTHIFVNSAKEGDVTTCTKNSTIVLFPRANKIFPTIIQKTLSHI